MSEEIYESKEFDGLGRRVSIVSFIGHLRLKFETSNGSSSTPFKGIELSIPKILEIIEEYKKDTEMRINHQLNTIKRIIANDPNQCIIEGNEYIICDENSKSVFRGYAGSKFKIKLNDGRKITTTNLWSAGQIVPIFKEMCPDNAIFEEGMA